MICSISIVSHSKITNFNNQILMQPGLKKETPCFIFSFNQVKDVLGYDILGR